VSTQTQNKKGEWVDAIPIPSFKFIGYQCECSMRFLRWRNYRGHYALVHIMHLEAR
jgi:hypothetical protein